MAVHLRLAPAHFEVASKGHSLVAPSVGPPIALPRIAALSQTRLMSGFDLTSRTHVQRPTGVETAAILREIPLDRLVHELATTVPKIGRNHGSRL